MSTKRIIYATAFCLYMAAVVYLCFARPENMPQLPMTWFGLPADKIGHFLMFAPFPLLGYKVLETDNISATKKFMLLAVVGTLGLGIAISTEQLQAMLAYRSAGIMDIAADAAGIVIGGIVCILHIFGIKR